MPFEPRFLTEQEKRRTLAKWRRTRTLRPRRKRGGSGLPDPEMIPWCAKLNAIRGVCTVQSCAGHGTPESVERTGHVWLRLDRAMSVAFDARALELAGNTKLIEQVVRIYAPWGQEVASITFAGNERGLLTDSMRLVLTFFRSLAEDIAAGR